MTFTFTVVVVLSDKPNLRPDETTTGYIDKPLLAIESADNEENAVRLAEQMVREAFRRHRIKHENAC